VAADSVFQAIRSDDEVEDAVVDALRRWLPTYMSEVERQRGLTPPYYARPSSGSYTVRADFDSFPEEILPLVVVVSPGIDDDPKREGRGQFIGRFQVGVTCIVSAADQVSTRRFAYRMGAAIRATLLQKQSLELAMDGSVRGVDWIGTRNNELGSESDRSIWACRQLFTVEVGQLVVRGVGPVGPTDPDSGIPDPADPPPDPDAPPGTWPTVETASVALFNEGAETP
jgi:hypothetical protein